MIVNKLAECLPSRHYVTHLLDQKYKNQNQSNAALNYHRNNKGNSSNNTAADDTTNNNNNIDYGENFDVADCTIEQWDTYTDLIKKNWVIRLISEKRELQMEILQLQQRLDR